jgi:HEAT repeat protein
MHWLEQALSHRHYGAVTAIILAEICLVQLQLAWLLGHTLFLRATAREAARFAAQLGDALPDVGRTAEGRARWVRQARSYRRSTLRRQIEPLLAITQGETRDSLVALYRDLGFLAQDISMSRSALTAWRMRAVRRLSLVASAQEAAILLERRNDHHMIRVLAAQTLVRVGTAEQLFAFMVQMRMASRLMEQPLAESLVACTEEQIDLLLDRLSQLVEPSLRRLVLVAAARVAPTSCVMRLPLAVVSSEKEVRIAACLAIARLGAAELAPLAIAALADEAFEVRAQAAKALGVLRALPALEALTGALGDRAFWVRQNAAAALGALGPEGRGRLEAVVQAGTDRFAVDTARQELHRQELRQTLGALAS